MKRLVIADDNENERKTLTEYFDQSRGFQVVGTAADGVEAVETIKSVMPDVAVVDLVMPKLDGFGVLKSLREMGKFRPKTVILSSLTGDAYARQGSELGADYYMLKPYDIDFLREMIDALTGEAEMGIASTDLIRRQSKNLEEKLSNIFISVGIPAHIKGYQFLREAVKMAIEKPEIINSITKRLYPDVAEKFGTSSSKVERAIRHAIEVAWNRGKIENINNLFGVRVYGSHDKPTNGEFIALVADKMLIEGA